jgi:hypothetical protein
VEFRISDRVRVLTVLESAERRFDFEDTGQSFIFRSTGHTHQQKDKLMAELANRREGAARLAVRSDDQRGLVVRGPVFTFGDGSDMCWLRVTFWVGEQAIFQQDVRVQWASIRNWPHDLDLMVELRDRYGGSFRPESPELMIEVEQTYFEPEIRFEPNVAFGYRVIVGVDTGIAAGESTVAGEGPCMYLFPRLEELQRFARELKAEARFVRLLEGLDAADFDYEAARRDWPFKLLADAADEDDWSI